MNIEQFTLEDFVAELRKNSSNDIEFARRVAAACCNLVERKADPLAAIRTVFRTH